MKLTVDASIVAKWSIPEDLSEASRLLLRHRLKLHAPDIVLAEFANIVWKKARRGEIADTEPYEAEYATIRELISLNPVGDLIVPATRIASRIDHPIYDCLYIACAEQTDSILVTADRRLARKAAETLLDATVRHIGEIGFQDEIRQAATGLIIAEEKLSRLIGAYNTYRATKEHVRDSIFEDQDGLHIEGPEERSLYMNSPPLRRLMQLIDTTTAEEKIDLLALGWVGQGYSGTDWTTIFDKACMAIGRYPDNRYLARLAVYWQKGLEVYRNKTGTK
jgi:predicted nucleic acid-binding protein